MNTNYNVIIVVALNDLKILVQILPYIKKYILAKKIVIIGNRQVFDALDDEGILNKDITFINENAIIKYEEVQYFISNIVNTQDSLKRTGWYLQQFIKMKYALQCTEEYYLVWDSDTVPLRSIEFFYKDHPVFNIKCEYNEAYFETMRKLVPGLQKFESGSFIAEHMMINVDVMKRLIYDIEKQSACNMEFWKVILMSINIKDLQYSGFSEFETYGNYCMMNYPDLYLKRAYDSFRFAAQYFVFDEMRKKDFEWIARDYPAASFEKMQRPFKAYKVFQINFIQKNFHIKSIYRCQSNISHFFKRVRNKIKCITGI